MWLENVSKMFSGSEKCFYEIDVTDRVVAACVYQKHSNRKFGFVWKLGNKHDKKVIITQHETSNSNKNKEINCIRLRP